MLKKQLVILLALAGISGAAQALTINIADLMGTESTGTINGDGSFTCTYDLTASEFCYITDAQGGNDVAAFSPLLDGETMQYKDNVGGLEEGPLAGSYETVFSNGDSEATITYVGGNKVDDAKLVVRAEKVRLYTEGSTSDDETCADGTIEAVDYQGQMVRYFVRVGDIQLQVIATIDEHPYAKGTRVNVCIRPRDCVVLPAEDDDK